MNGRMYDPMVSRFLSADPVLQAPDNLQNYNRYAYVLNNPLKYVDPSGYQVYNYGTTWSSNLRFDVSGGGTGGNVSSLTGSSWYTTYLDVTSDGYLGGMSDFLEEYDRQLYSPNYNGEMSIHYFTHSNYLDEDNTPTVKAVRHEVQIVAQSQGVIDNSWDATKHYYTGGGKSMTLGPNSVSTLMSTEKFQTKHQKIITGNTSASKGYFSVNMTWEGSHVFHIGNTYVDYSVSGNSVTYQLFSRDGFWDPDYIDEKTLGKLGVPFCIPDGPGPNLERGGTPYHYIPVTITIPFK